MAGLCPGHPRLPCSNAAKTWMPGTRPGMTSFATETDFIGCFLSQTLRSALLRASRRMGHGPHGSRRPLARAPHHEGLSKRIPRAPTGEFVEADQRDSTSPVPFAKIFRFTRRANHLYKFVPSHPTRGAYHDRHGRGEGCGGRGSVLRATGSQGGLAKGL